MVTGAPWPLKLESAANGIGGERWHDTSWKGVGVAWSASLGVRCYAGGGAPRRGEQGEPSSVGGNAAAHCKTLRIVGQVHDMERVGEVIETDRSASRSSLPSSRYASSSTIGNGSASGCWPRAASHARR